MSTLVLIAGAVVLIFVWRLRVNVKRHTRGLHLGRGVAGPGISAEAQESRVQRYLWGASAESRAQEDKIRRKMKKAKSVDKREKLRASLLAQIARSINDERVAEEVARGKTKAKGHGIRRSGSERGRLVK